MTRICTMGPTPPAKGEAVVARSRGRSAHATRKRTRAAATRNLPMLPNPTKFSLTPGHAAITKGQTANDQSAAHVLFRSGKKLAHAVHCVSYVACARQCPVSMRHYRVCRKWRRGDSFGRRQQHWRNHPIVPGQTYLPDRKSVGEGKRGSVRVGLGGASNIKKKK